MNSRYNCSKNNNFNIIISLIMILFVISCSNITKSNDPKDAGDTAPSFTLNSVNGDQVKLEDFSGKVVLLFFFGNG